MVSRILKILFFGYEICEHYFIFHYHSVVYYLINSSALDSGFPKPGLMNFLF